MDDWIEIHENGSCHDYDDGSLPLDLFYYVVLMMMPAVVSKRKSGWKNCYDLLAVADESM